MNIALVSQEYPLDAPCGGIGTYTYHLSRGLARQGHSVQVLSMSANGRHRVVEEDGVTVRLIPNAHPLRLARRLRMAGLAHMLGWSWSAAASLTQLSAQRPLDVVECPLWDAEALIYSLRKAAPLVVRAETPRSVVSRVSGLDRRWWAINLWAGAWLEAIAARRATLIIAISEAIAQTIRHDYHVPPAAIRIGPLGIPQPLEPSQRLPGGRITFLYAGRLEPRKGTHFLLRAIPRVIAALPEARFLIVGRDTGMPLSGKSYRVDFQEGADAGAIAATSFLGEIERPRLERLFAECDVFVAPSLYESFGLAHLEAMSYGKPVVAFRCGATPEVVADGHTGLLVTPGDVDGLAEALIQLGRDAATRTQMGKNARERARTSFSVAAMVDRTVQIYAEAIAIHRPVASSSGRRVGGAA